MEQQKGFSIPFFVTDENCNFVPEILPRIHTKFLKDVLIADSYNSVSWANSFIPMPIQTLEQIMVLITKFKFSRSRDFLFPVIRLAVHINRFHTGKKQLKTMIEIMKSLFNTEEAMRRFDEALMILFSNEQTNTYMTNIALSMHENGLPDSKFMNALKMIYRAGNSFDNQPDNDIESYNEKLKIYNYLIKIPKYTLKAGVDLYNENIKDLSIGIQRQPTLLFTSRNDFSLKAIYNDVLFLVSAWNMIINYKKEQRRLFSWITFEINSLMENVVLAAFQLPDLKEMTLDLSALIANMNLLKPNDDYSPHFKLIINKFFEIGIFVTKSYICILPSFVKSQLISFENVLSSNRHAEDVTFILTSSKESDDEYDEDKPPRQVDPDRVDNILMESDFFNVKPENAFSEIALMPISHDKIIDVNNSNIQVLETELAHTNLFVYSAIAQKYDLPLKEYVERLNVYNPDLSSGNSTPARNSNSIRTTPVLNISRPGSTTPSGNSARYGNNTPRSITPVLEISRSRSATPSGNSEIYENRTSPTFRVSRSATPIERSSRSASIISGESVPGFFNDQERLSPNSPISINGNTPRQQSHGDNEIQTIDSTDEDSMNAPQSPQSIYSISSYVSTDDQLLHSPTNSPFNLFDSVSEMQEDTE